MSEPVQLAKAAREHLAAALNALQSDLNVPTELVEAAEPIAQAMTVLHRIERTRGANLEGRDGALSAVRSALERVQKVSTDHPAIDVVMEAIAASLSKVHALARFQPQPALQPTPAPTAAPSVQAAPVGPGGVTASGTQILPASPPVPLADPSARAQVSGTGGTHPAQPGYAPAPRPPYVPPPQPAYASPPQPAYPPAPNAQPEYASPQPPAQPVRPADGPFTPPQPPQHAVSPDPLRREAAPIAHHAGFAGYEKPVPEPPREPVESPTGTGRARPDMPKDLAAPGGAVVDVELGTHSASNFYKGLGGNDVIEHGGVFVGTYRVPRIGAVVSLRVLLPGDYEFRAVGVVQWIREGGSAEPGFGARFTQITPEGRQLVYRYTRNREPMFYDDL